jgi:hypothetical protein
MQLIAEEKKREEKERVERTGCNILKELAGI